MDQVDILFKGNSYIVKDIMSDDPPSIFFHQYTQNHMLWFKNVGYCECRAYLAGDITIRTATDNDILNLSKRKTILDKHEFVVITYDGCDYIIQCTTVLFWDIGEEQTVKNDTFWFHHEEWKQLWDRGKIIRS